MALSPSSRADERPPAEHGSGARSGGLALALALAACSTTPIDAVVADTGGQSGGGASGSEAGFAGGGVGGEAGSFGGASAGDCPPAPPTAEGGPYWLQVQSSGGCLTVGMPWTVRGTRANLAGLTQDCNVPPRLWSLVPTDVPGAVNIRNVTFGSQLDIELGGVMEGTRGILYEPVGFPNQRFFFRPRGANVYEIQPAHTENRCLSEVGMGVQIFACNPFDSRQDWLLLPSSCP